MIFEAKNIFDLMTMQRAKNISIWTSFYKAGIVK